jgi:hypothetical protein
MVTSESINDLEIPQATLNKIIDKKKTKIKLIKTNKRNIYSKSYYFSKLFHKLFLKS